MKYIISSLILVILLLPACSKKEESKLEVYNAEAFAYDLGDSSEVNATARVKGFTQDEKNDTYTATLAYDIDIVTPEADTLKSLISKVVDKSQKEKLTDVAIEAQFDLDSTYVQGQYQLIFRVKDARSEKTGSTTAKFKLEK